MEKKVLTLDEAITSVVNVSICNPQFTEEMVVKSVDTVIERLNIIRVGCGATSYKIPNIGTISIEDYNGMSYDPEIEFKLDTARASGIHLSNSKLLTYEFDTETSFTTPDDLVESLANKMYECFVELGIYMANFTAKSFHNKVVIIVKYRTRDNC